MSNTLHLPSPVMAHCLAFGPSLTPDTLRRSLETSLGMGYSGLVIVPAIASSDLTPELTADIFGEFKAQGLVCGFLPGNGPDPIEGDKGMIKLARESIESQALFASVLADAGWSNHRMVGPMHTVHRKMRSGWDGPRKAELNAKLERWIDELNDIGGETFLDLCLESLNPVEDGTHDPFRTLDHMALRRLSVRLHWDTGHAFARKMSLAEFMAMAPQIGFFEFANVGRHPLHKGLGIDFAGYAKAMNRLPANCNLAVEPFDPSVINAFGLQEICTTTTSGPDCLKLDASFLESILVKHAPLN